jgi:transcriptional regulator with XRE-family HTH domain
MPKRAHIEPNLEAIGRRFRELRGAVRQVELAPVLGITQGQLSKIEKGQTVPTVAVLLRLRARFGVSVDWVLTAEGEGRKDVPGRRG